MVEYCEIYISGVRLLGIGWVQDADEFLEEVANTLSEIERFVYISLSINMSQVYNYQLKVSSYDAMMLYLKGVRYKGGSSLSSQEMMELDNKLRHALSYIYGLTIENIETRCNRKFEFDEVEQCLI